MGETLKKKGMKQTPIKYNELANYPEKAGRYYMISFIMMDHIFKETKIFQYKHNLTSFVNKNSKQFSSNKLWILDEKEE